MQHLTNVSTVTTETDLGWVITRNGVPCDHGTRRSFVEHILPRLVWNDQGSVYQIRRCHPSDDLSDVRRVYEANRPFTL